MDKGIMNTNELISRDASEAQRISTVNRRRFLKGLGACLALPAFESFRPLGALAASSAKSVASAPRRMAFMYFPNGAHQGYWWPKGEGKDFVLNQTMQPLEKLKHKLQVISGLDHRHATAGPDGAGDHARANGTFLTGVRVKKTAGGDIRAGVSIDQIVARQIGHLTRFPSLELSCDAVRKSGNCDSGYSCAYQYNLAWSSSSTPVAPEPNPRLVFERLFGAGPAGQRAEHLKMRQQQQRSILDFVLEDAHSLQRGLVARDKQKLDEYLTSVREIEKRIQSAERFGAPPDPSVDTPIGIPPSFQEHMRIMYEMLALAFQTDSTRVATLLLSHDGSNRAFPDVGIPEGHHYLSHHRNNTEMMEKIGKIDLWYMQQFAWFLDKLEQTKDIDGKSLLDNTMIVYGCGNSDGNRHTHSNLPILLAGGGGGTLQTGRYLKLDGVPMSNLLLSMADRMGAKGVQEFGDATGRLENV
jgi:hypothetical protein